MTPPVRQATPVPGPGADPVQLLSALVRHFRAFERQCPQFELGESRWLTSEDEPADLEKGVLIIYHAEHGSGEVRAWVSPRRVKLKAHREDAYGLSRLEERFVVRLGEQPTWGDREFERLGEFAAALIDFMRRRLADLARFPRPAEDPPSPPVETPELAQTG